MIEASTDIQLGEAIRPSGDAHRRVYGGTPALVLLSPLTFAGFIVVGSFASFILFPRGGWPSSFISLAAVVIGGIVAIATYSRLHMRGFLKALRRLGSPDTLHIRFRFDDFGISTVSERVSHSAPWAAVQFIVRAKDHWLAQIDTTTLVIPFRAFARATDEQAFVALAKTRLSENALARSILDSQ